MELKTAIDNVKQAKALLSDANNVMSVNVSRLKNLESENAELKAEIERLKNALPGDYMKLPVDADGVTIRPGDEIYFSGDPESVALKCIAIGSRPLPVEFTDLEETGTTAWEDGFVFTHRPPNPEPPDSFELIARESEMDAYSYCEEYGIACGDDDCPAEYSMYSDLVRRMRAVAARG